MQTEKYATRGGHNRNEMISQTLSDMGLADAYAAAETLARERKLTAVELVEMLSNRIE